MYMHYRIINWAINRFLMFNVFIENSLHTRPHKHLKKHSASIEKEKKGLCFVIFVNGRKSVFFFIMFMQTAIHECLL